MAETTVNLGMLPQNRGEYSSSAIYYKDNIVQYNGSSYICTAAMDLEHPSGITGVAPYDSDPATPNTGWAVFSNDSSGVGEGVYNVSVDHTTDNQPKVYASLSAALQDVPQAKKKGGMSIKFIQSSDNKYVQYRLLTDEWSTTVSDWQGVDDVPTGGSDNLVKSGGVDNSVGNLEKDVIGTITIDYINDSTTLDGTYNDTAKQWQNNLKYYGYYSKLIPVSSGKKYTIIPESGSATNWAFVTAAPQNMQDLSFASGQIYHARETEEISISTPEDAVYLVVTYNTNSSENLKLPIITYIPKDYLSLTDTTKTIDDIQGTVGNFRTQNYGSSYDSLGGVLTQPSIAAFTVANSECDSDGYISEIHITTNASGTLTFMVGLLDQRRNAVNTRTFDVTIPNAGENNIKLDTPVYIRAGEQLFVFTNANIPTLKYKSGSTPTDADVQVMVSNGGYANYITYYEQSSTAFPYGIVVDFNYTVKSLHDSLFEEKADADITKKQVESLSNAVQSAGIVYDENQAPYRLYIYNGQIRFKSLTYTKVVALGNSLTDHGYASNIGWYGKGYSMAATKKGTSWTERFADILKNYNLSAQVIPFNIYQWERNPHIDPSTIVAEDGISADVRRLEDVLTSDVDCVIFRAGENDAATTMTQQDYEEGLTSLVNFVKTKCPVADIIISQLFWHNTTKDTAFYNVASSFGLKFIYTGNCGTYLEMLGDICMNYDNSDTFHIQHNGVANHTDDYGFYLYANILANAVGLTQLEELHTISIESSIDYAIKRVQGVTGSIKTIQTFGSSQPTITVTDSDSNNIPVTHINMSSKTWLSQPSRVPTWCSIFTMPNSDVNVVIQ